MFIVKVTRPDHHVSEYVAPDLDAAVRQAEDFALTNPRVSVTEHQPFGKKGTIASVEIAGWLYGRQLNLTGF